MSKIIQHGNNPLVYVSLRQLPATNLLTKIVPSQMDTNPITRKCQVIKDNLTAEYLLPYTKYEKVSVSMYKLLDAIVAAYTEQGNKSSSVTISLNEYSQLLGVTDRNAVRVNMIRDLALLDNIRISCVYGKQNALRIDGARFFTHSGVKNSIMFATLSEDFVKLLKRGSVMPCPGTLWRIHPIWNPHSYFFLRKLAEHKKMNKGAPNEDRTSVRTLLKATPLMPSYERIASGTRHITKQILHPFQRDMDALSDTLAWRYCRKHGVAVPPEELRTLDFYHFEKLLVQVEWKNYPKEQTESSQGKPHEDTE